MKIAPMPLLDGLRVVHSKIHGYGAVTTRPYQKGDVICYGDGVLYRGDAEFDDTYCLVLSKEDAGGDVPLFWDLVCQTRWFNHSCDPNTEVMLTWERGSDTMLSWWVALRDIPVGEEITYDYAFVAEVAEPCHCGAAGCHGVIVDDDPENLAQLSEPLRALLRGSARAAS
jgi:SET domain